MGRLLAAGWFAQVDARATRGLACRRHLHTVPPRAEASKAREYRRTILLSHRPLDGLYRFEDGFQLLPADASAPTMGDMWQHHRVILEYTFEQEQSQQFYGDSTWSVGMRKIERKTRIVARREPDGIPAMESQDMADERVSHRRRHEILALLNVFLDGPLFTYGAEQMWFLPRRADGERDPGEPTPVWGQACAHYPEFDGQTGVFTASDAPPTRRIEPQVYYWRLGSNRLEVPTTIDELLRRARSLPPTSREAFGKAAWFYGASQAGSPQSQTLSFLAQITAIETLAEHERGDVPAPECPSCNQKKYQSTSRFKEFVRHYGGVEESQMRQHLSTLYGERSAIVHRGRIRRADTPQLPWGEDDGELRAAEKTEDDYLRRLVRSCLANWVLSQSVE